MGTTESLLSSPEEPQSLDGRVVPSSLQHGVHLPSQNGVGPRPQHRPSKPRVPPVEVLKGIVLGLPCSGKRTLLQRLKGRDPFDPTVMDDHQPLPVHGHATVPYKPPTTSSIHPRIMLNVQVPHALDEKVNFAVVLINPRHDPKHVAPYIANVIQRLLLLAGYPPTPTEQQDEDKEKQSQQSQQKQDLPSQVDPFCLCILLNFRDLQSRDEQHLLPQIHESDVKTTVTELLKGYPPTLQKQILLKCGTASLFNCYGLSILHEFIYESYLRHKKTSLEKQLFHVQQELDSCAKETPPQHYNAYVKLLNGQTHVDVTSTPHQEPQRETGKVTTRSDKANDGNSKPRETTEPREGSRDENDPSKQNRVAARSGRRNVMDTKPHRGESRRKSDTKQDMDAQKSALEAFLAEEDDEDDAPLASRRQRAGRSNRDSDESEDDSDEDFFYDETGTQRGTHPMTSDSSSDDEERSQEPTHAPTTARSKGKQPRMPSISEHQGEERIGSDDTESDDSLSVMDHEKVVVAKKQKEGEGTSTSNDAVSTQQGSDSKSQPAKSEDATKDDDLEENTSTVRSADENADTAGGTDQSKDSEDSTTRLPTASTGNMSNTSNHVGKKDGCGEERSPATNTGTAKPPPPTESHSDSSDDDDFVVEEGTPNEETIVPAAKIQSPIVDKEQVDPVTKPPSPELSGMSAAALAAVAAAQREAELMLQQEERHDAGSNHSRELKTKRSQKKKKKKKDDISEKKKKKKKRDKERRSKTSQESSE